MAADFDHMGTFNGDLGQCQAEQKFTQNSAVKAGGEYI